MNEDTTFVILFTRERRAENSNSSKLGHATGGERSLLVTWWSQNQNTSIRTRKQSASNFERRNKTHLVNVCNYSDLIFCQQWSLEGHSQAMSGHSVIIWWPFDGQT